jgi:hypothetical protein
VPRVQPSSASHTSTLSPTSTTSYTLHQTLLSGQLLRLALVSLLQLSQHSDLFFVTSLVTGHLPMDRETQPDLGSEQVATILPEVTFAATARPARRLLISTTMLASVLELLPSSTMTTSQTAMLRRGKMEADQKLLTLSLSSMAGTAASQIWLTQMVNHVPKKDGMCWSRRLLSKLEAQTLHEPDLVMS